MFNIFHHLSAKRMASSHGFPTSSHLCLKAQPCVEHLTSGTTRSWRCEQVWTIEHGGFNMLFHAVSSWNGGILADSSFTFKRPQNEEIPHSTGIFSIWGKGLINKPRWENFQTVVIAKLSALTQIAGRLDIPHRKHGENTHGGIFSFNPNPQIKQLFLGIHWIHQFQEFLPRLSSES